MVNQYGYLILLALHDRQTTLSSGLTRNNIVEETQISLSQVKRLLSALIDLGYVAEGAPASRAKAYYITDTGEEILTKSGILNITGGNE